MVQKIYLFSFDLTFFFELVNLNEKSRHNLPDQIFRIPTNHKINFLFGLKTAEHTVKILVNLFFSLVLGVKIHQGYILEMDAVRGSIAPESARISPAGPFLELFEIDIIFLGD